MRKHISYIVLLFLGLSSCTHRFDGVQENTPVGNFECLWQTIDEKYCFLDEKGVDWDSVHAVYLPKVKGLDKNDYLGLFDTLAAMLNLLEDGHVNLYSSFDVSRCSAWYEGYPENFVWDIVKDHYLKDYRIAGGAYYNIIHTISGDIGYLYCRNFETAVSPSNMSYIIRSFRECKGMIVDVRNNGGGSLDYALQLAAAFYSSDATVGYWCHKSGPGRQSFSPEEPMKLRSSDMSSKWLRPVVVLCNRNTYSAANFFVSIMRYADNALLVGGTSGGGGGMPLSYEIPNGWLVRFSSIRMTDIYHQSIERGIEPDIKVNITSTDRDDIIEKAIEIIHNKTLVHND